MSMFDDFDTALAQAGVPLMSAKGGEIKPYEPKPISKASWEGVIKSFKGPENLELGYRYDIDFNQERLYVNMRVKDSRSDTRFIERPFRAMRSFGDGLLHLEPESGWEPLVNVGLVRALDKFPGIDEARIFIRECVKEAVLHEMDEWIRFDGELVFDPHDPEKAQER